MKKAIFAALITITLVVPAFAGTYTITTTDDQEVGLTWARGQNTETTTVCSGQDGDGKPTGCTATPKYADNQTYLQAIMGSAFDSYVKAKGSAGN